MKKNWSLKVVNLPPPNLLPGRPQGREAEMADEIAKAQVFLCELTLAKLESPSLVLPLVAFPSSTNIQM